jgi:hypothetical protein
VGVSKDARALAHALQFPPRASRRRAKPGRRMTLETLDAPKSKPSANKDWLRALALTGALDKATRRRCSRIARRCPSPASPSAPAAMPAGPPS